jgi:hypothetical protein
MKHHEMHCLKHHPSLPREYHDRTASGAGVAHHGSVGQPWARTDLSVLSRPNKSGYNTYPHAQRSQHYASSLRHYRGLETHPPYRHEGHHLK